MNDEFLGDSYDLVKRFWAESLSSIAPIYAEEAFVPKGIHETFTQVTKIPIFHTPVARPFAIFLDPCTGIPSPTPNNAARKPTTKYAPLSFIIQTIKKYHPEFLICFDQSYSHGCVRGPCMEAKRNVLTSNGLFAFYYASHATFLFVSESPTVLTSIKERLLGLGIPGKRLNPNV